MRKISKLLFISLLFSSLVSCIDEQPIESPNFLEELRPTYFDQLNFNEAEMIAELPIYLGEFTATYDLLEENYKAGDYTFEVDLENMNLTNYYYSSLLIAVTKAYLDGFITFDNIMGDRERGLFSGIAKNDNSFDLEREEMNALATRAVEVAAVGRGINGENDKSNIAYIEAKHIYARLNHPYQKNEVAEQRQLIRYAQEDELDFEFISVWNLMKGLAHVENYEDELNTFDNPEMDSLLDNAILRIDPVELPNLNTNFTSLLAAIYLMDIVMKKVDWLISKEEELSRKEVSEIRLHILRMNIAKKVIFDERLELLTSWEFQPSFKDRIDKIKEIENYMAELNAGQEPAKPKLAPFFNTKSFRQAYQCYSCHKVPNL